MSRRSYSDAEKKSILGRLYLNHGDITLTSLQTAVPERTLSRWRSAVRPSPPSPSPITEAEPGQSSPQSAAQIAPLSANESQALRELQRLMLANAHHIGHTLSSALAEASLSERVAAVTRLVETATKLAFQLSSSPAAETITFVIDPPAQPAPVTPPGTPGLK